MMNVTSSRLYGLTLIRKDFWLWVNALERTDDRIQGRYYIAAQLQEPAITMQGRDRSQTQIQSHKQLWAYVVVEINYEWPQSVSCRCMYSWRVQGWLLVWVAGSGRSEERERGGTWASGIRECKTCRVETSGGAGLRDGIMEATWDSFPYPFCVTISCFTPLWCFWNFWSGLLSSPGVFSFTDSC